MQGKHYVIIAIVALAAFAGGFFVANRLNRAETDRIRTEIDSLKAATNQQADQSKSLALSDEEIAAKLAEAERNASDFQFQKSLGIALYRYGAMKQDAAVIEKALPVLERANGLQPNEVDVLTALGNAHFDIGYFRKENEPFIKSREYYARAMNLRPKDVELQTDIALTYFLQQPPDLERASAEFERSLALDPKHEKTLQFYAKALAKQEKREKAKDLIERLKAVNPQNPSIAELTSLLKSGANNE